MLFRSGSITNTASQRSFDSLMHILDKWEDEIKQLLIPDNEKDIYLGYLAYQLSICMILYGRLLKSQRAEAIVKINSHISLFSYTLNSKTSKVHRLVNCIGIKNSCYVLRLYTKFRSALKLG